MDVRGVILQPLQPPEGPVGVGSAGLQKGIDPLPHYFVMILPM